MSRLLARPARRLSAMALMSGLLCLLVTAPVRAQQTLSALRQQGQIILDVLKSDVQKNYYDPTYHGVDVEARFAEAGEKIKQANSLGEINSIIGAAMLSLKDSHTYFIPPSVSARIQHGWTMSMIGDGCYVTAVQPGSNAELQGLRPGDRVDSVEGRRPTRANFWQITYVLYVLAPRTAMALMVEKPDGKFVYYPIKAAVQQGRSLIDLNTGMASARNDLIREAEMDARLHAHRYYERGEQALIWKMPEFDLAERQVDEMIDNARKRKALVLDLRGNGGGAETTLLRLVGGLFDHDVQIGELKRRKEAKPLIAKTRGDKAFKGQLVVLVDSDTGSAGEVLARIVQLEKRGTVIGDKTSGSVRRGHSFDHQVGSSFIVLYGASVTDAELLLADGHSLEGVGITPDELILPQAADLASHRDPVLARAAQLVGLQLSPEQSGAMFPVEWKK
jgi:C-terminal processing protease CtpA/Prc